jgi:hypothetical protein
MPAGWGQHVANSAALRLRLLCMCCSGVVCVRWCCCLEVRLQQLPYLKRVSDMAVLFHHNRTGDAASASWHAEAAQDTATAAASSCMFESVCNFVVMPLLLPLACTYVVPLLVRPVVIPGCNVHCCTTLTRCLYWHCSALCLGLLSPLRGRRVPAVTHAAQPDAQRKRGLRHRHDRGPVHPAPLPA